MLLFVIKIFRALFLTIDHAVYQCVDWLYQLFIMLAETGIFSSTQIREFSDRIYFFLGLIMVFKVSISILQYIMNPDSAKDSKMGAPKLLKNIIIVLVGIVMVPYVFEAAYSLQRIVLRDNIIGNLILGLNYTDDKDGESFVESAGDRMAFSTFTAFFRLNSDYFSNACANNPFIPISDVDSSRADDEFVLNPNCEAEENFEVLQKFVDGSKSGAKFKRAYETLNMHLLAGSWGIYTYTIDVGEDDEVFLFDYTMIICTLAGAFLAYILLLFCFDIAVRSVKLGFLQLIAPIPLIAKIDPKKGDEVFNKWVKECTSTYLNLFVRLVAIYFAIFIISIIGEDGMFNVVTGEEVTNPFVFVFIIFGALLFVKDLPKLIETITGMKISAGGLSLGKKMRSVPLIGGATAQAAGFAGRTAKNLGRGLGNAVGKGVGKAGRGIANKTGLSSALAAAKNSAFMTNTRAKLAAAQRWSSQAGRVLNNVTDGAFAEIGRDASLTGRSMVGAVQTATGVLDSRERLLASREGAILESQAAIKARNSQRQAIADTINKMEERAKEKIKEGLGGALSDDYRKHSAALEVAKRSGTAADIEKAQAKLDAFMDHAAGNYISMVNNGTGGISDGTMKAFFDDYKATVAAADPNLGIVAIDFANDTRAGVSLHSQSSAVKAEIGNEQRTMIADNQELEKIKEERRQIAETRRAGKDSMGPGFGPGGGPK